MSLLLYRHRHLMIVMTSQPIANPSIDWSSRNPRQEYTTFMEMCKLRFTGGELSYMGLWGGSKALTHWINPGDPEQTASKLTEGLKHYCVPTDRLDM